MWASLFVLLFTPAAIASRARPSRGSNNPRELQDTRDLDVDVSPSSLWPPDGRLRRVRISVGYGSGAAPVPGSCLAEIFSSNDEMSTDDEVRIRPRRRGTDRTATDRRTDRLLQFNASSTEIADTFHKFFDPLADKLYIRAKKVRRGSGRSYHIAVRCIDDSQNLHLGMTGVNIPKNGHSASDNILFPPMPGKPGAWKVCVHDYDIAEDNDSLLWGFARIYAPVVSTDPFCSTFGKFHLAIVAHADAIPGCPLATRHLCYEELATHLASNGFLVVSVNRYVQQQCAGAIDFFGDALGLHLDHLYGSGSPVKGLLTDDVALIGHSAGGKSCIRHADVIASKGKNLVGLVVLAPTINISQDKTFEGVVDTFLLGLHGTHDEDGAAFGSKTVGNPMSSTFKIYDDAKLATKDMIFIQNTPHFFQNGIVPRAYINACMQTHMHGHSIYNRFLKSQGRPPSFADQIVLWQQHSDADSFILADFENGDGSVNAAGGDIAYSANGISEQVVGEAHVIDDNSPHHTKVLKFRLDPVPGNGKNFIIFEFPTATNLEAYSYLSIRATQVYDPNSNEDAPPRDFRLIVASAGAGESGVDADDIGGRLHFPIKAPAPIWTPDGLQVKNAMRSYIVRLGEFSGANLDQVEYVKVLFPYQGNNDPGTTLILDDVEFYKW